jgi:hypothetical protein
MAEGAILFVHRVTKVAIGQRCGPVLMTTIAKGLLILLQETRMITAVCFVAGETTVSKWCVYFVAIKFRSRMTAEADLPGIIL